MLHNVSAYRITSIFELTKFIDIRLRYEANITTGIQKQKKNAVKAFRRKAHAPVVVFW